MKPLPGQALKQKVEYDETNPLPDQGSKEKEVPEPQGRQDGPQAWRNHPRNLGGWDVEDEKMKPLPGQVSKQSLESEPLGCWDAWRGHLSHLQIFRLLT